MDGDEIGAFDDKQEKRPCDNNNKTLVDDNLALVSTAMASARTKKEVS